MADYKAIVEITPIPDNGIEYFLDEKPFPDACVATFESGKHKGVWIFSTRQRAEEFCWKRGLHPKFLDTPRYA